ncbi:hypothetical protein DB31_1314 [Hyalangium minutum]|uniref:Uncharacterized protein n=1 Tax=Hyalangium minutum TaxID=394096 RepID=A0A085WEY6_9BACT|nr:hypothetical protein DB31_1314 [Hyalangium minutum]
MLGRRSFHEGRARRSLGVIHRGLRSRGVGGGRPLAQDKSPQDEEDTS